LVQKNSAGYGLLLMEIQKDSGSRGTVTGQKLWSAIKESSTANVITHYWRPDPERSPPAQNIQSKAQTFTVAGNNIRPLRKLDF
jgi:IS1 family transposase